MLSYRIMFTKYLRGMKCVLCGLLPFQLPTNNNVKQTEDTVSIFDRERNFVSGRDRLYHMFSVNEVGSFSPELLSSYQATVFGAFVGATYGGYKSTKLPPEVIERNKALALTKKFDERNATAGGKEFAFNFVKGAFQWGWRVGLFCGCLKLISTATSVYRGKSGILEYTLAGAVMGPLLRWKGGLRTMGVGGLVGIALGTVGGCAMYGINKVSGTTIEETRFWQYGWKETQLQHTKERIRKLKEESLFIENNDQEEHTITDGASKQ